jgi:hypothetical protein
MAATSAEARQAKKVKDLARQVTKLTKEMRGLDKRSQGINAKRRKLLLELNREGMSQQKIADMLGYHVHTIYLEVRKAKQEEANDG